MWRVKREIKPWRHSVVCSEGQRNAMPWQRQDSHQQQLRVSHCVLRALSISANTCSRTSCSGSLGVRKFIRLPQVRTRARSHHRKLHAPFQHKLTGFGVGKSHGFKLSLRFAIRKGQPRRVLLRPRAQRVTRSRRVRSLQSHTTARNIGSEEGLWQMMRHCSGAVART